MSCSSSSSCTLSPSECVRKGFVLPRVSFATGRNFIGDISAVGLEVALALVTGVENCLLVIVGRGMADVLVLTMVGDGLALRPAQLLRKVEREGRITA